MRDPAHNLDPGSGAVVELPAAILGEEQAGRGFPRGSRPWVLDYTLREFLGEEVPDPQWPDTDRDTLARLTVGMSIAAILDALGRYVEDSDGQESPADPQMHSFFYNGRTYEFAQGEFPEHDALLEYRREVATWEDEAFGATREGGMAGPRPEISEELKQRIAIFAEEALGYLAQREW